MASTRTGNAALGVVAVGTLALAAAATYKYAYKHEPLPKVVSGTGVARGCSNPRNGALAGLRPQFGTVGRPIAPLQARGVSTPPLPPAAMRRLAAGRRRLPSPLCTLAPALMQNLRMPDFAALRGKLPAVKMPAFKLPAALQRKPAQA